MQLLNTTTHQHQSALANYCRTGILDPIPNIKKKNISHYRRLVYNIVDDMLQSAYPLTYDLLSAKEWNNAVDDFFTNHSCQSPQVWYMPKEFYDYIVNSEAHTLKDKYPFIEELLLFEWIEVEMFMMEDIASLSVPEGNIEKDKLVINPEHQLHLFHYPVHNKKGKKITETDKGDYFICTHRHPHTHEIIFTDITPAFARMMEYLSEKPLKVNQLFSEFEKEFNTKLSASDRQSIVHFFTHALEIKLIIGFQP